MRNFLRKRPDGRRTFDIAQLAREVIALVQADARRERVTIQFDIPDALPGVHADRTEINQVLFNLLSNAIEACAEHAAGERRVVLAAALTPGHAVEVQVADTGAGFVDGVAEHLFDPFFSTKQEGMGMGLSICRTIVEAHGGVLRARNNSQGGATFTFELPVDGEELHDVA
jgi:two-component system sensor histidine kinase DctS